MFPFRSFLYNFTLSNSNHVLNMRKVKKKRVPQSKKLNSFQNNCAFFVFTFFQSSSISVQPCILINQALLKVHEMKCAWYLLPSPTHLLVFLFSVFCFNFPITRAFFNFPWRFELLGVDCNIINSYLRVICYFNSGLHLPIEH